MISWGIVAVLFTFVQNFTQLTTLRFLLGVAEAGFFPGAILFLSLFVPARYRSGILGLLPGAAAHHGHRRPGRLARSARTGSSASRAGGSCSSASGPAIIVGVIAWFYLSDSPAKTKWLNDDEKEWLTGELTAEAASKTGGHERHSVRAVFRNGRVWTLSFIYFGFVYGLYTLAFFLPTIISGFEAQFGVKFDYIQKGFITAIPYLPAAVALYLVTRHATKHGVKPGHIIIPALAGAVSILLALYAGSPALTIAIITVTACAIFSALPNFWTVPTQFLTGAAAAAGIALINTMGNLAASPRVHHRLAEGPHRRLQDVHVRRGRVHARVRPADGGAEPPEAGRAGPRYGGPGRALTDHAGGAAPSRRCPLHCLRCTISRYGRARHRGTGTSAAQRRP